MANGSNEAVEIPKTITPWLVWIGIGALAFLVWVICTLTLTSEKVGLFLTLIALGVAIFSGVIAVDVVDFHGVLVFDPWRKKRRVFFSGLHFKLPWEKVEEDGDGNIVLTSLVRTVSSKETKPHPTNDPAAVVEASLLIHIRVNISGVSAQEAADNFIRFRSIKEEALTEIVRVEIEKMFAEYYGDKPVNELLKPHVIQKAVMEIPDNITKIQKMEEKYGINIGVVLESSKPDKATQDMMRTPAIAEALRKAMSKLMENEGMDVDQARRAALILDPNNDYTEERFDLHVAGLENARDITVVGDPRKGGKK
jgi:hypothetical protein